MELYHIPVILITGLNFTLILIFNIGLVRKFSDVIERRDIYEVNLLFIREIVFALALYVWLVSDSSTQIGGLNVPSEYLYVISENINGWISFAIIFPRIRHYYKLYKGGRK